MTSTVKDPLAALYRAIQTKDGQQFAAAYAQLTACNVCHQRWDRTVIVIQQPTAPFPDQGFHPISTCQRPGALKGPVRSPFARTGRDLPLPRPLKVRPWPRKPPAIWRMSAKM